MTSSSRDNAAILLTPRAGGGGAAIAVVRLRGPAVETFLAKCFSRAALAGQPVHGELRDGNQIIDDPLVVLSEDRTWADLNLHGGASVIRCTLELALREGFEVWGDAGPPIPHLALDEVPTTMEKEVLAYLPMARTGLAIRALLDQPAAWAAALRQSVEIPAILADRSLWLLLHPPQVALTGEPNVGKSTLANQLFGRERSITADVPGTTRDWVGEIAGIDGLAITLVDTPGIRTTTDELEQAAIAAASDKIRGSDLVVHVLDATHAPADAPARTPEFAEGLLVVNKMDCELNWDLAALAARTGMIPIPISAKTGQGLDELRRRITAHFDLEIPWKSRACWWTPRQREILQRAIAQQQSLERLSRELL